MRNGLLSAFPVVRSQKVGPREPCSRCHGILSLGLGDQGGIHYEGEVLVWYDRVFVNGTRAT